MSALLAENRMVIACTHPDYLATQHDLSEFFHGISDLKNNAGRRWNGGFRGRPGLMEDLLPIVRAKHSKTPPTLFASLAKRPLRSLFRWLDAYEQMLSSQDIPFQSVERLHQLTGTHLDMMRKPSPHGEWKPVGYTVAASIRGFVLEALYLLELPSIFVPHIQRSRQLSKDPPAEEQCKSLFRFLRHLVLGMFARWERADSLALVGRDMAKLRGGKRGVMGGLVLTEADAHATYRAVIAQTGHPSPSQEMVRAHLGLGRRQHLPDWWPRYSEREALPGRVPGGRVSVVDLASGLYPTYEDIMNCVLLCLWRSAWNVSTLLSIDVENWNSRYDDRAVWMFAPKGRAGGAYQYTVGSVSQRTGMYQVVAALIARSEPLRRWIRANPDAHPTPTIAARSPWCGKTAEYFSGVCVPQPTVSSTLNRWLKNVIARHNGSEAARVRVPSLSCGDFRDAAAAWTYRKSRYSTWVTMLLLGHTLPSTTRIYLASRSARAESHAAVKSVMDDVFAQLLTSRHWDPTVTRAKIEGVAITAEAMNRLARYRKLRSYDGTVCSNPFSPPSDIDPKHPKDGETRCIQGHRCAAACCPNANVFNESMPWLARRAAELEWQERQVGVVRFSSSTDATDLAELRNTLLQWPSELVSREIEDWHTKIAEGLHKPLRFAGQHR